MAVGSAGSGVEPVGDAVGVPGFRAATVSDTCFVALVLYPFAATVKANVPALPGVPLSRPSLSRVRPSGRAPAARENAMSESPAAVNRKE